MRNNAAKVVLIGGAQRSGTTLLQTLLANAIGARVLPEAHILCDLMASFRRAKDAPKKTQYFYAHGDELLAFFSACAERHIADIAGRNGGDIIVLKDPNFVLYDGEAAELLPHAIRIVSLRDPRDIAASFLRIGQRETGDEAGKYRRRDLHFIGKKIIESYAGLNGERAHNLHFVRYEDLAKAPKAALQALARDAGLKLSLDRVDNAVWLEADARHDAAWVSELEEQSASSQRIGAYRTIMSPREVALIEQICAPVMEFVGYERSQPPAPASVDAPAKFARGIVNRLRKGYWSYRARFP